MSFAFVSCNQYGIVASADHRLTGTNAKGENYTSTNYCRKLFCSKQRYVVTFTGKADINGFPIPAKISELWEDADVEASTTLSDFFAEFVSEMSNFCSENIVFIAAGYQDGSPRILTATTTDPQVKEMGHLGYSGEVDIAKAILNAVPVVYDLMTLQDRIDFHRFVTQSIAKLQYHSDRLQTVSESCDIVVIEKRGITFSAINQLH